MKLIRLAVCADPRSRMIEDFVLPVSATADQRVLNKLSVALAAGKPGKLLLATVEATAKELLEERMTSVGRESRAALSLDAM